METGPNILLIRFKSIGDVVFTLPAVNRVRAHFPSARITFLTSRENGALVSGFAAVDEIVTIDRTVFQRWDAGGILANTLGLVRRLRRGRFDLAVDFQGYGETEWLSWLSGAPERWGNVYRRGRGWTYTRAVRREARQHPVDRNLALLKHCGLDVDRAANEFVLPAGALDEARRYFAANQLEGSRPTLFIQPFTSSLQKDWPLESVVSLARQWQADGRQVLFGGGPADRPRLEPVRAAGFPVAAGVPLLTAAGLMKLSTLVVGADTGLLHLAVALGRRVVMIINSNAPGKSHPFQHPDWTLTPPAGKPVAEIPVAAALAACEQAFRESAGPAST